MEKLNTKEYNPIKIMNQFKKLFMVFCILGGVAACTDTQKPGTSSPSDPGNTKQGDSTPPKETVTEDPKVEESQYNALLQNLYIEAVKDPLWNKKYDTDKERLVQRSLLIFQICQTQSTKPCLESNIEKTVLTLDEK